MTKRSYQAKPYRFFLWIIFGLCILSFGLQLSLQSVPPHFTFSPSINTIRNVYSSIFLIILCGRWLYHNLYRRKLLHCTLTEIDHLSGKNFEFYLYFLFRKHKIRTKITPYTHDFGADLILSHRRKKIVIQAKRWNETVGIKAVQETIGAMKYYRSDFGIVITNSFYSLSAIQLAKASDVILIDRNGLQRLINQKRINIHDLLKSNKHNISITDTSQSYCPYCKNRLVKRSGKYGDFLGCSNYPNCTFTKKLKN